MAAPSRRVTMVPILAIFERKSDRSGTNKQEFVVADSSESCGEVMTAHAPTDFKIDEIVSSSGDGNWIKTPMNMNLGVLIESFKIKSMKAVMNDASPVTSTPTLPTNVRSAFNILMTNRQPRMSLPEPKKSSSGVSNGISNKDKLYNDMLSKFREENWLFQDLSEAAYVIQRLTDALWAVSGHEKTITDAHEHDPLNIFKIPSMFSAFREYNKRKAKQMKLTSSDIKSQSGSMVSLSDRPSLAKYETLRNGILNFSKCLKSYGEYLQRKCDTMKVNQALERPVRVVSENLKIVALKKRQVVLPKYSRLDNELKQLNDWDTSLFVEQKHLEKLFNDRHERFKFFSGMELSCNALLLKYCPGGASGSVIHLIKLPEQCTKTDEDMNIARITAALLPKLPEFHTRAMKRNFKQRIAYIANVSPAVMDYIYQEISGDTSAVENLVMQQRLRMAAEGEPGIITDLRRMNPGRPSEFDVFWTEAKKLLNEISAADERRRASGATSDAYMSEFISYPDLRDRIASRCPPDTLIPSVSTLRLATAPANPYCARAQAFSGILDIKHKVQTRQLRASHPDAHFCAAEFRYLRERASSLKVVFMTFIDDKAKIPLGEPGMPVSTAVRARATLTPTSTESNALDHDVNTKGKLTPTIMLMPEIPQDFEDSWYQGSTTVVLHDSILEPSNAIRNAALMIREYRQRGAGEKIVMKFSDGGAEHRSTFIKVQLSYVAMMKILDLDMIIACRCAPGQSWVNPVERINSIANLALQNVSTSRTKCSDDVEETLRKLGNMDAIRKKASRDVKLKEEWKGSVRRPTDLIAGRLSRLSLKGKQFRVEEPVGEEELAEVRNCLKQLFPGIDAEDVSKKDAMKDREVKRFFEDHARERTYVFQVRKKRDCECCGVITRPDPDLEWLPDPILENDQHYKKLHDVLGTDTTDEERPGHQRQFKAGGKVNPFMEQAHQENLKDASSFTSHNARHLAICLECGKSRVVYTKEKLNDSEMDQLYDCLNEIDFTCGSSCVPPGHPLWGKARTRLTLSCRDPIESAYFTGKNCPAEKTFVPCVAHRRLPST